MTSQKTLDEYVKKRTPSIAEQQPTLQYKVTGFYTEFQETPIRKIPSEWRLHRLVELFSYVKGKKPKGLVNEKKEGYLPYLTTDYLRTGIPSNYAKPGDDVILVDDNDILLLWDGSNAGEFFLGRKGVLASTMVKLQPRVGNVNKPFYYYYLKRTESRLKSHTKGTGIPHVDKLVFENLLLPIPSLEEQWGIAEVLSTVDKAIEGVDRVVARLEQLKKALMRELLTGRVRVREENGKLVFYRETKLQETEIGKIPSEWKLIELAHLAQIIMGQSPPSSTYNREGIGMPFLQGKMEFGRVYPSPVTYTTQPLKTAEPNDVLISVRAPVGDANIAPCRLCIGRGLAAIRFNPKVADYMFYFYYFQTIKEHLEVLGKGSTFKAITKKDLEKLKVVQPPVNEQKRIAEVLSTVDKAIELYYEKRARLERLKRGLMDLLLTGRVRVRVESVS